MMSLWWLKIYQINVHICGQTNVIDSIYATISVYFCVPVVVHVNRHRHTVLLKWQNVCCTHDLLLPADLFPVVKDSDDASAKRVSDELLAGHPVRNWDTDSTFSCVDLDPYPCQFTCHSIQQDCPCFGYLAISSAGVSPCIRTRLIWIRLDFCVRHQVSGSVLLWSIVCVALDIYFMVGVITVHSEKEDLQMHSRYAYSCTASCCWHQSSERRLLRWASAGPFLQQETSGQIKHLEIWVTGAHEYLMQLFLCGRVTQWFEAEGERCDTSLRSITWFPTSAAYSDAGTSSYLSFWTVVEFAECLQTSTFE